MSFKSLLSLGFALSVVGCSANQTQLDSNVANTPGSEKNVGTPTQNQSLILSETELSADVKATFNTFDSRISDINTIRIFSLSTATSSDQEIMDAALEIVKPFLGKQPLQAFEKVDAKSSDLLNLLELHSKVNKASALKIKNAIATQFGITTEGRVLEATTQSDGSSDFVRVHIFISRDGKHIMIAVTTQDYC